MAQVPRIPVESTAVDVVTVPVLAGMLKMLPALRVIAPKATVFRLVVPVAMVEYPGLRVVPLKACVTPPASVRVRLRLAFFKTRALLELREPVTPELPMLSVPLLMVVTPA